MLMSLDPRSAFRQQDAGRSVLSQGEEAAIVKQVFDLIQSVYGCTENRYDRLAHDAGVVRRTSHNWLSRTNSPRLSQLVLMMRNNEQFREGMLAMFNRLTVPPAPQP